MPIRSELIPLTQFSFNGVAASTQEVQLIKYIPVGPYVSGLFEVRVAAKSALTNQTIAFVLQPISKAEDEPEATYFASGVGVEVAASVTNTAPSVVPGLIPVTLITPVPAFYRLIVRAIQHPTAPTVMTATVSASLTLREA